MPSPTGRRAIASVEYLKALQGVIETQGKLVKDLYDHGVTLVPGSGSPNPWIFPGVALIDELAPRVRIHLGAPEMPLACILEGGTWAAGRKLAEELRDGTPPFAIDSDGTVF